MPGAASRCARRRPPARSAAGRGRGARGPARIVERHAPQRARLRPVAQTVDGVRTPDRVAADARSRNPLTARLEHAVGRVLRVGVITSSVFLALGLGLSLFGPAAAAGPVMLRAGLVILMAT